MPRFYLLFIFSLLGAIFIPSVGLSQMAVSGEKEDLREELTILLPGDVELVLVPIPAGSFVMGSPEDERSRSNNEGPQTNVTLTRDFYMGKYPVTQAQWEAVMESWPFRNPSSGVGVGPNFPAYFLSWDHAQDFVAALNAHILATGQGPAGLVRLPTEAEWAQDRYETSLPEGNASDPTGQRGVCVRIISHDMLRIWMGSVC